MSRFNEKLKRDLHNHSRHVVRGQLYLDALNEIERLERVHDGLGDTLRTTNRIRLVFQRALEEIASLYDTDDTWQEIGGRTIDEIIPNAFRQAKALMPPLAPKTSVSGDKEKL